MQGSEPVPLRTADRGTLMAAIMPFYNGGTLFRPVQATMSARAVKARAWRRVAFTRSAPPRRPG